MHGFTKVISRTLAVCLLAALALPAQAADEGAKPQAAGAKKKVVFLAGGASHGFGSHDHLAGCHLLANRVKEVPGFDAVVVQGWPKDESVFEGASAVIMYSDGGGGHFAISHIEALDALHEKGVGIGAIHYAVEVVKGKAGDAWLKWMGGYFETMWSVNPHWTGSFANFPKHPVAGGLEAFGTNDEWYYNMRFRPEMKGVTPILSAVPPDKTRQGKDSSHGGNPEVRKGVGKEQAEHVLWASDNANGSRGFGTTGGHFHRNWVNDDFRKAVLNSIVWIAKGDVPAEGIKSKRPDIEEMMSNHDLGEIGKDEAKKDEQRKKLAAEIESVNKTQDEGAKPKDAAARS